MKRLLCILLCLVLALSLAACAQSTENESGNESSIPSVDEGSSLQSETVTVPYTKQMVYAVSTFGAGLKNQPDMSAVVPTMELLFSAAIAENEQGVDNTALEQKYPGKAVILADTVEQLVHSICGPDTTVRHSTPSDYNNLEVNYYPADRAYVMTATGTASSFTPYFLKCRQQGDVITAQVVLLRFAEDDFETLAYYDENGLNLGTVSMTDSDTPRAAEEVERIAGKLPQRIYTFRVEGKNYYLTGIKMQ